MSDFIPDIYKKRAIVLGCGNILFGDDGFGPAVVEHLEQNCEIPDDVFVLDAGTGVREILFDLILSERKPEKIVIVDSVEIQGKEPGNVFEIPIEVIPDNKIDDFSMHQLPTSNLLKELKELCDVDVAIIVCQTKHIPGEVKQGLSSEVQDSIPEACNIIMKRINTYASE